MKTSKSIFYILISFILAGCSYSFTGSSIPPDMKTIAIPVFDDMSGYTEAGLRENLTNSLIQKFIQDNSLQVVDRKLSDTILEGVILSVRDEPFVIAGNEQVNSRRVLIQVKVRFSDQRSKKHYWEKNFSQYADYSAEGGIFAKQQAIQKAIENLTEDILISTVSDW
ncbi:MAG: LptE family protein [Ignavibacteria bacterium]